MPPSSLPPGAADLLVPVGWILLALVAGVGALLTGAWRLFVWLEKRIERGFNVALHGETFQAHIRATVAEAFTGREEADRARFEEMTRIAERMKGLQERFERHEMSERAWHEETRREVARALEQASRFPAEVARQYQAVRQELLEIRRRLEEQEKRLDDVEGKVSTVQKQGCARACAVEA